MSVESAKAFLQKFKTDSEFRQRFEQTPDPEARRQMAKQEGFDFTKDDIKAATGVHPDDMLNDADLDKVAGGVSKVGGAAIEVGVDTGFEIAAAFF